LKVPYSILPLPVLRKVSGIFIGLAQDLEHFFPFLDLSIKQNKSSLKAEEYLSMCFASTLVFSLFLFVIFMLFLPSFGVQKPILISLTITAIFSGFIFLQQLAYPRLILLKRIREIERNLLPSLQNFLIQLNSGVPVFDILVNISDADYGAISQEFKETVKSINTGTPQSVALEKTAEHNPSLYFRRAIWQIVNGLKAGADIAAVIREIIFALSEEQVIQIQKYGSQLNPLAMFYMLVAVIAPSLGITFIIVLSTFVSPSTTATKAAFYGLFSFVLFFQIVFLGVIKSRRPNLLGA